MHVFYSPPIYIYPARQELAFGQTWFTCMEWPWLQVLYFERKSCIIAGLLWNNCSKASGSWYKNAQTLKGRGTRCLLQSSVTYIAFLSLTCAGVPLRWLGHSVKPKYPAQAWHCWSRPRAPSIVATAWAWSNVGSANIAKATEAGTLSSARSIQPRILEAILTSIFRRMLLAALGSNTKSCKSKTPRNESSSKRV